jgi:hypothetical protein
VKFNDGTFEAFNSAGGSVMQAYGNLFHGRQLVTWNKGGHILKAGVEARLNRDTTYFGISPNGEYDFGGGSAYSTETILSQSGTHNVAPEICFLTRSADFSPAVQPRLHSSYRIQPVLRRNAHRTGSYQPQLLQRFCTGHLEAQ